MKQVFILLLLVLKYCDCGKVTKRFINEEHNNTDDSFQVNVSAGYGVHSENVTISSSLPVYKSTERQVQTDNDSLVEIHQDQLSQASQPVNEILPTPSYQVHEKSADVQEKRFQPPKNHRYRSVEKRVRHKNNEVYKPVNEMDYREPIKSANHPYPKLASGTKIVEVLRVPAMYELHLQSDPQRLVSLNSAWLNKLNTMMNQNHHKRTLQQQYYDVGSKNLIQQASTPSLSYAQPISVPPQRLGSVLQNLRQKIFNPNHNQIRTSYGPSQTKIALQDLPQIQNVGTTNNNFLTPQNYQNNYNLHQSATSSPEIVKNPDSSTQAPLNYQYPNNELSADYYQKPQALHEVPAPALNKQSHKHSYLSKAKPTPSPYLIYGKHVDSLYQTTTQSPIIAPGLWSGNVEDQNKQSEVLSNNQFSIGYSEPINNYFQQDQTNKVSGFGYKNTVVNYPQYHPNQSIFSNQNYKGYRNVQNYYNDAIGNSLDQTLMNVNGDVATYVNDDGTVTVSNFHHNPKLYKPPPGYEIPVNEEPQENLDQNYNLGITSYGTQENDLLNLNNQLYSGYNAASNSFMGNNQLGTIDNRGYGVQTTGDLTKIFQVTSRSSGDDSESRNNYGRNHHISKRVMYPKLFSNRRRIEPMDYIVYIKERIFD